MNKTIVSAAVTFVVLSGVISAIAQTPASGGRPRTAAEAKNGPDCSGKDRWPANMAYAQLKNTGDINVGSIDHAKTTSTRLASEPLSKGRYRQVHQIVFYEYSGKRTDVITVNDALDEECSGSGVTVFVVAKQVGP